MSSKNILWHSLPVKDVFKELNSFPGGITDDEAKLRKNKFGYNELPKKKQASKLGIFFTQFKSALVYILLVATVISFLLGDEIDAYVILAAVIINVIVGFLQENKAQNALAALSKISTPKVKVIRQGVESIIETKDLVPGDVIDIEAGDRISADARLFEEIELEISEAPLTGESSPVKKKISALDKGRVLGDRENMVYAGTLVLKGKGKAVIIHTGLKTEIGQIAGMLSDIKEEATPLQKRLAVFSRLLGLVILFLGAGIFILGILNGRDSVVMFNTAVAVAVAAIPEGMLVAVTVILALGMQSILKKKALVRRLVAAETLGSTTVICTDKTGTLTLGEMRVAEIVTDSTEVNLTQARNLPAESLSESFFLLRIAMLCNDAIIQNQDDDLKNWQFLGSGTETALMLAAAQIGLKKKELEEEEPRVDEITFNSERKFMATLHRYDGHNMLYVKGAPEKILAHAKFYQNGERQVRLSKAKRQEFSEKYKNLSRKGLRVLAFGYQKLAKNVLTIEDKNSDAVLDDLILLGFAGIKDPLRENVRQTLELTAKAGIKTVIITGDNKITAKKIAEELGLATSDEFIFEGEDMLKLDDQALRQKVRDIKIYARVTPKDKLRIVEAWQSNDEVVAMTGDGVNDAPALKKADVGIALGSGSDVAKETADLVLLDNSFSTIVSAIERGRIIYDNIKKVILYLLSDSFSEVILIMGSLALGMPLPLLPAQILWINLVTDGFPALALTVEPGEKEIMNEPPQERNKPILDSERRILIGAISLVTAISSLAIFYYFWKIVGDLELARSVTFAVLGIDSLLYVFSCRTLRHTIFHSQFFVNKYLIMAVVAGAILQIAALYLPFLQKVLETRPLNAYEWLVAGGVSLVVILIIEIIKWVFIARHKK